MAQVRTSKIANIYIYIYIYIYIEGCRYHYCRVPPFWAILNTSRTTPTIQKFLNIQRLEKIVMISWNTILQRKLQIESVSVTCIQSSYFCFPSIMQTIHFYRDRNCSTFTPPLLHCVMWGCQYNRHAILKSHACQVRSKFWSIWRMHSKLAHQEAPAPACGPAARRPAGSTAILDLWILYITSRYNHYILYISMSFMSS